jgi:hypothetical protein
LKRVFCTGIPNPRYDFARNQFWQNKLRPLGRAGVEVFSRQLVYRTDQIELSDGEVIDYNYSQEKGIDVRIAVDIIRAVYKQTCDVILVFSQDQDLSEAASEAQVIAREQGRLVEVASAYPFDGTGCTTAIGGTIPIKIDRGTYDACIDHRDYRPPKKR